MSRVSKYINLSNWGPGRTFLVGGSAVLAGLSTFYLSLVAINRRQVAAGRNPYYVPDMPYTKAPDYVRNYEKTPGHALKTEHLKAD
ncbi:hypothetical protein CPB84DRAFT_1772107 [Gymnopilus junonius]|uniref:Uncharacterized protein n=1 Tax=Gymnopilus junonius TaxID=109634 RepID=A0A9P5NSN5_GYMJU|nr:hypothetical protein CPB84DRAFT_1772107 [Gymnopilus junonius]